VRDAAIDDIATCCYTFVHARLFVPAYLISFNLDRQRFMTRVHERTQCKSCVALQFFRPFFALRSSAHRAAIPASSAWSADKFRGDVHACASPHADRCAPNVIAPFMLRHA
jgi:hypothetical protein